MAFPSVKLVVQKLFADPDFRARFVQSPDETLRSVAVSSEERRALLHLRTNFAANGAGVASVVTPTDYWP